MTWGEILPWGLPLLAAVLLLAMDERNRRKFAAREDVRGPDGKPLYLSREDAAGMVKRIDEEMAAARGGIHRNGNLFVALDDRVGDLEEKTARIEERQTQQWERISEQMASTAATIREVTAELKEISRIIYRTKQE